LNKVFVRVSQGTPEFEPNFFTFFNQEMTSQQKCKATKEIPQNVPLFAIEYQPKLKIHTTNAKAFPIDGMTYIPNFLSEKDQDLIWNMCYEHSWSNAIHRRQQFWGPVYFHTTQDLSAIQPEQSTNAHDISKFQFLIDMLIELGFFSRQDPPTQILVNEYVGPMGIASHFDESSAFGDTIVTISLGQPIWMSLVQPLQHTNQCQEYLNETKVLLETGSLFAMQKSVRYDWRHGITKARWVLLPDGSGIKRTRDFVRISLTIRKLLTGRKRVLQDSTEWISVS
jgi:alkylated DNA repair dioxygenase AlkB